MSWCKVLFTNRQKYIESKSNYDLNVSVHIQSIVTVALCEAKSHFLKNCSHLRLKERNIVLSP